jgi:hypothetical protein
MLNSKHVVGLTSSEIASLWSAYISNSLAVCLAKFFVQHLEDKEAKSLVAASLKHFEDHIEKIKSIFTKEKFPVPRGYTEEDVDLSAPPLFFQLFPLSYVYAISRIDLNNYATYVFSMKKTPPFSGDV